MCIANKSPHEALHPLQPILVYITDSGRLLNRHTPEVEFPHLLSLLNLIPIYICPS